MKKRTIEQSAGGQEPTGAQETAAEIDWEKIKQERWLYRNFFESLKTGVWRPTTDKEIEQMVEEKLFAGESITPLSEEEESLLKLSAADNLCTLANNKQLRLLLGDVYYEDEGENRGNYSRYNLYLANEKNRDISKLRKLSLEDKVKLLLNQEVLLFVKLHESSPNGGKSVTSLIAYGNRSIQDYGLHADSGSFLRNLIEKNGIARVLDIGSGMGLALHNLKKIYGDRIDTYGFSLEQEMAMFPIDHQHYGSAERFPKEFSGKFDFIFSNMAFRYFLFQNIALGNVVRALRSGGMAEIHFSYGDFSGQLGSNREIYLKYFVNQGLPPDHYDAMKTLVEKEITKLEHLHDRGLIDFRPSDNFSKQENQGTIRITKREDFDYDKEE